MFHAFPEIPEMFETDAHKKFNCQHYPKTRMSQIIFLSNREIKMPRNIVLRLNREIKIPRNSKIVQKPHEIKIPQKFRAAKIFCFKVYLNSPVIH